MARRPSIQLRCAHAGCTERSFYENPSRDTREEVHSKPWHCLRHAEPETVLSFSNHIRTTELQVRETPSGKYWGNSGFIFGPGFRAWADDFPVGTTIRITVEVF